MILVVLPVFSEANLNTRSQSDVSQSRWIYWIYCECLGWLDCPVDTLLPGNIMGNALQSLCTSLLTHGSLGMEYNYWKARANPLLLYGEDQDYPGHDVTVSPVHQHRAAGPGNGHRAAKTSCETAGLTWAPASCMLFLHGKKEGGEASENTQIGGEM